MTTALILNGKYVASTLQQEIQAAVFAYSKKKIAPPGLAVILVGHDPASQIYVKNKRKACMEVGFNSQIYHLPDTVSEGELIALLHDLNKASEVNGILVQLPLPPTINKEKIIECISPGKDVDGFHPYNIGCLAQNHSSLRPCTPYGIIQLLTHYQLPLKGKHAVVVGASNIVGRPMALEFLSAGATVTVCHRLTSNLEKHINQADIVVVATGKRNIVKVDWLHSKQIVVDVGIHRLNNGSIQGDIDFTAALSKVAWITPVPGGVGPMTIASLLKNTLSAANKNRDKFNLKINL